MVRGCTQTACGANIIPGGSIALEGMLPTDGLLAGLSPTLVGSLRDALVAQVVSNMEDEGRNI